MISAAQSVLEKCVGCSIVGILSCDLNGVIGACGKIPWHITNELKFFRDVIGKSTLIMGRKTFESMPPSILHGRTNIVFSKKRYHALPQTIYISSMEKFQKLNLLSEAKTLFMIGGAQVAQLFFEAELISKFILTKINATYHGDAFIDLSIFSKWNSEVIYQSEIYTIAILTKSDKTDCMTLPTQLYSKHFKEPGPRLNSEG